MGRDAHATAAIVWTYFTELVEVSVAQGEVVPQGQVRSVQHLEGGVVLEIFVLEGNLVEAVQPLVQVELSASEAQPRRSPGDLGCVHSGPGTADRRKPG